MSEITLDNAESSAENESDGSLQTVNHEKEAAEMGWAPKEKWRGDPERWVDAETFYERGQHVLPIVKKQLEDTKRELEKVKQAAKAFEKFTEEQSQKALNAKIAELEEKRAQAITEGDGKAAVQVERELKKIEQAPPPVLPEYKEFIQENPWYDIESPEFNLERQELADSIAISIKRKNPDLSMKSLMNKTVEQLKRLDAAEARIAEEESGTMRQGPARGGKPAGNNSKVRTFDSMSSEYKDAAKQLIAAGMITKEKYVQKLIEGNDFEAWGE